MADDGLERRAYKPGEIIFSQGDVGEDAFIVESGRVEIARGDGRAEIVLSIISPSSLFGEMALIDKSPRMASARALGKTNCIVIPRRVFDVILKNSNPVLRTVLSTLLARLRNEGEYTVKSTL